MRDFKLIEVSNDGQTNGFWICSITFGTSTVRSLFGIEKSDTTGYGLHLLFIRISFG